MAGHSTSADAESDRGAGGVREAARIGVWVEYVSLLSNADGKDGWGDLTPCLTWSGRLQHLQRSLNLIVGHEARPCRTRFDVLDVPSRPPGPTDPRVEDVVRSESRTLPSSPWRALISVGICPRLPPMTV